MDDEKIFDQSCPVTTRITFSFLGKAYYIILELLQCQLGYAVLGWSWPCICIISRIRWVGILRSETSLEELKKYWISGFLQCPIVNNSTIRYFFLFLYYLHFSNMILNVFICRCDYYREGWMEYWYMGPKCNQLWNTLDLILVSVLPAVALVFIVVAIFQCVYCCKGKKAG